MKLRTRLNLVVAGLTALFVAVLCVAEVTQHARFGARGDRGRQSRGLQLLGRLAAIYSREGGTDLTLQFLQQLGRVRANDIILKSASGEVLYRSPPPTYKAGRTAPEWFSAAADAARRRDTSSRCRAARSSSSSPRRRGPSSTPGMTWCGWSCCR